MFEFFDFLHFIGLGWGLGGATIATIISIKAEKDPSLGPAVMKLMAPISKLIFGGLILLIISGIALPFFMKWPLDQQNLIIKHVLVVLILVFGIVLGISSKKIKSLSPQGGGEPSPEFLKIKKRMKLFSTINFVLWYLVTLMSVFI